MKKVFLTTDGACKGNPGPGGWAALLRYGSAEKMLSGFESHTTNNRMELLAVIEGLRQLKEPCRVLIKTDSKYVMDAFEKGWVKSWPQRGWKTSTGAAVKNQDLWEELISLVASHQVQWTWIKGHSGDPDNERVDAEAQRQATTGYSY